MAAAAPASSLPLAAVAFTGGKDSMLALHLVAGVASLDPATPPTQSAQVGEATGHAAEPAPSR